MCIRRKYGKYLTLNTKYPKKTNPNFVLISVLWFKLSISISL